MSTRYTIPLNNLDTNNPNTLLSYLGFTSDHTINEAILDKLFLHEKYANYENHLTENFSRSAFNTQKAFIAELSHKQKIKIFAKLLRMNKISADYYNTQIWRYEMKTLQTWCKHSIFKQLAGDYSEKIHSIGELPLPTPLRNFLKG